MDSKKLASYLSLQSLLENNFPEIDVEKVSNLVVANFEIKQLFKEELTSEATGGITEEESEDVVEEEYEDVDPDVVADEEHKRRQMAESKEILKRMREEALTEATAEHWGLGEANGLINPATLSVEEKLQYEREQSTQNITSGARGSFRRG